MGDNVFVYNRLVLSRDIDSLLGCGTKLIIDSDGNRGKLMISRGVWVIYVVSRCKR